MTVNEWIKKYRITTKWVQLYYNIRWKVKKLNHINAPLNMFNIFKAEVWEDSFTWTLAWSISRHLKYTISVPEGRSGDNSGERSRGMFWLFFTFKPHIPLTIIRVPMVFVDMLLIWYLIKFSMWHLRHLPQLLHRLAMFSAPYFLQGF